MNSCVDIVFVDIVFVDIVFVKFMYHYITVIFFIETETYLQVLLINRNYYHLYHSSLKKQLT